MNHQLIHDKSCITFVVYIRCSDGDTVFYDEAGKRTDKQMKELGSKTIYMTRDSDKLPVSHQIQSSVQGDGKTRSGGWSCSANCSGKEMATANSSF